MSVVEAYVVRSGLRSRLAGGVGMMDMTGPEVSAMANRLTLPERAWLEAMQGDARARLLLKGWLWQSAAGLAVKEDWVLVKGGRLLGGLAEVVTTDLLRIDGYYSPEREIADKLKLTRASYRRGPWPLRYRRLRGIGGRIVENVVIKLKEQLFQ